MEEHRLRKLLSRARSGDESAREELIAIHRSYLVSLTSKYQARPRADDEGFSIAMLAFNEAIDTFDESYNKAFHNYAAMVVKRRLIDHFRKESRHRHFSLDDTDGTAAAVNKWEAETAWSDYRERETAEERAEELLRFEKRLGEFGLSLNELVRISPKHRDTRETLTEVAIFLSTHQSFSQYTRKRKKLPLRELSLATGVGQKVLKRGRKYILALFLILSSDEFLYLRSLFDLPSRQKASGAGAKGGALDG